MTENQQPTGRGGLRRQMLNRVPADVRQRQIEEAEALAAEQAKARQRSPVGTLPAEEPVIPEPDWDQLDQEEAQGSRRPQPAAKPLPVRDLRTSSVPSAKPPVLPMPDTLAAQARHKAAEIMRQRLAQKNVQVPPETPAVTHKTSLNTSHEVRNELLPPVDQDPIFRTLAAISRMRPLERVQILESSTRGMEFDVICRDPQTGRRFVIDKGRVFELTAKGLVPFETLPDFLKGYEVGDLVEDTTVIEDGKIEKKRAIRRRLELKLQF